jgi:hypothetical protein
MSKQLEDEIRRAAEFRDKAEQLILLKGKCPTGDRNTPLMAYWSLVFEFHKAVLSLITDRLYGAAFAIVRPIVEATVRAHLVIFVSEDVLKKIGDDEYRTNFGTVGKEIDAAIGTGDLFENFLNRAKDALHGYTHIGVHQLGRRFVGTDLTPNYSDDEIDEVIRTSTSAVFMVNNIVAKHLEFDPEWKENTRLFVEWGEGW